MTIKEFMAALEGQDFVALSKCFTENGKLNDYCPATRGKQNFHVYGSRTVEMFYRNQFVLGGLRVSHVKVETPERASFLISYGNQVTRAVATVTASEGELLSEVNILPA